ncbi:MAG: molybdopterin cofactor-binding domain-containing protein [Usitatibacter sp.]
MSALTRREFLKASALAGGGLVIGLRLGMPGEAQAADAAMKANAWVSVSPSGVITVTCHRNEMGQDVHTSLTMLVAEELAVDPRKVKVVQASVDPIYINKLLGGQITGGSTSVRDAWEPLRQAGATARVMLVAAAAGQWKVSPADCTVADGWVMHGGKKLAYGKLAGAAAKMPVPKDVPLKKDFKLIGTNLQRLDGADKARGKTIYGIDVKQPKMLHAYLVASPVIGGKVASVDSAAAEKIKGVKKVVNIGEGVAVIADHFWTAKKAGEALKITWDNGPNAGVNQASIMAALDKAKSRDGFMAKKVGDVSAAKGTALEATYSCQMLSHATLEPQNCTSMVGKDGVDVWASTQFPQGSAGGAAAAGGVKPEQVRIHPQFIGGGFGRRLEYDFVVQSVMIAKAMPGVPVKLIWMRPDDMRHDFYRPPSLHVMKGSVEGGKATSFTSKMVSPSVTARAFPPFVSKEGNDPFMTEGLANFTYDIPNYELRTVIEEVGVRVGYWRSVSNALNSFATESFIDEMALAAKQDPLAFRLAMLEKMPLQAAVLKRAGELAGYTATPAKGRAFGVASMECYDTHIAIVCEVASAGDKVKLVKITAVADAGLVVHPDQGVAQLEGGIVTGLMGTLRSKITVKDGRVEQSNFHDFQLPRITDVPPIVVELYGKRGKPGGLGEVGVPLVAPAVANAVYNLTGKRIRALPLEDGGVTFA